MFSHCLFSYPKSGRTWLWYAACQAISVEYNVLPAFSLPLKIDKKDLFARCGLGIPTSTHATDDAKRHIARRCLMTRDPLDIVVSTYFWRGATDWDQHIESETNRICAWLAETSAMQFDLVLSYEYLQSDFRSTLQRFLDWLGAEWSERSIDHAEHESQFDRMRERGGNQLRKGISGDWRNHLTDEQCQRIRDLCTKAA